MINYVMNEKKDDQKEYFVNKLVFLQPDEFELKTDRKDDSAKTSVKLYIEKIPEFTSGSKMFLNPRIYKIYNVKLPATEKRTKSFYFHCFSPAFSKYYSCRKIY